MKLAEALQLRADPEAAPADPPEDRGLSRDIKREKLLRKIRNTLLADAERDGVELEGLIRDQPNERGCGDRARTTMTEALAHRDVLGLRHAILNEAAQHASFRQDRYSKSEVSFRHAARRSRSCTRAADDLARERRELDAKIQAKNWEADMAE